MMTRTETISRLCQLVAEIEEIRTNTSQQWWVYGDLGKIGEDLQGMLKDLQEENERHEKPWEKNYVTVEVGLDDSIIRRLEMCKRRGLTKNDLLAIRTITDAYDNLAAPIYASWLKKNFGEQGNE